MNVFCKASSFLAILFALGTGSANSIGADRKTPSKKPAIIANIKVNGGKKGSQTETITEEELLDFLSSIMEGVDKDKMDALKKDKKWPTIKKQMIRPMIMDKAIKIMGMTSDVKDQEDVKKRTQEAHKNIVADAYKKSRIEFFSKSVTKDTQLMKKIKSDVKKMGPLYTISLMMTSSAEATRIKTKIESASANTQASEWLKLAQHLKLSPQETTVTASELRQTLEQRQMTDVTLKVGAVIVVTPDATKDKSMILFIKEKKTFEEGVSRFDEMVDNKVSMKAYELFIKDISKAVECTDENGQSIELSPDKKEAQGAEASDKTDESDAS